MFLVCPPVRLVISRKTCFLFVGEPNPSKLASALTVFTFAVTLCMPTDSAEQVAADHSATVETPAEGVEAAEEAESVEVSPQPVDSVAKTSQSWADLSQVQDSPVPSRVDSATVSAHSQGSLVEVKEEIHEAETISAVIATTGSWCRTSYSRRVGHVLPVRWTTATASTKGQGRSRSIC